MLSHGSHNSNASPASETGGTPVLPFRALDRLAPIAMYGRHLPHWQQAGCTYFVTFRLGDSIPPAKLRQWEAQMAVWLRTHPTPHSEADRKTFDEQFTQRFHKWLDAGYGECWLRQPELSLQVESALRHFDGERCQLGHFVVMPNHVHCLVRPGMGFSLPKLLHSWKSFTAHQINTLLKHEGKLWQDESFDHIVRNETQLHRFTRYILENPLKSELKPGTFRIGCGSGGVLGTVGQASRLSRNTKNAPLPTNVLPTSDVPPGSGTGGTPVLPL